MKIRVPEYFSDFRCIADKCLDSCCIGWEISIDGKTKRKYASLDNEIGREIAEKTKHGYFPLEKDERCAFLDESGLCRIISSVGDEYLCDICREHPRYYGVSSYGIEGGIGLSCEAAARIILALDRQPGIIETERELSYDDVDEFAEISEHFRNHLLNSVFSLDTAGAVELFTVCAKIADDVAFDASTSGDVIDLPKINTACIDEIATEKAYEDFFSLLDKCEALTDDWNKIVAKAKNVYNVESLKRISINKGLLYYFTHRYVREGVEDMSLGQRVLFALLSSLAITAISHVIKCDEPLMRAAVMYSKNIEYSTDNVDMLLDELSVFL